MKNGKVYMVYDRDNSFWMLGRCVDKEYEQGIIGELRGEATFITSDEHFQKEKGWCYQSVTRSYREATQEEIAHLAECEKAGIFIPLPKIINSYTIF